MSISGVSNNNPVTTSSTENAQTKEVKPKNSIFEEVNQEVQNEIAKAKVANKNEQGWITPQFIKDIGNKIIERFNREGNKLVSQESNENRIVLNFEDGSNLYYTFKDDEQGNTESSILLSKKGSSDSDFRGISLETKEAISDKVRTEYDKAFIYMPKNTNEGTETSAIIYQFGGENRSGHNESSEFTYNKTFESFGHQTTHYTPEGEELYTIVSSEDKMHTEETTKHKSK